MAALSSCDQVLCCIIEKAGIKENLSEVRRKQKMLTLVMSGCFT